MLVVEMPSEILKLGQPAPVSVRDAQGGLLIRKGTLVASEAQRQRLLGRTLYVDESEGEVLKRLLSGQLDAMLRQNAALGQMAKVQTDASSLVAPQPGRAPLAPVAAWSHLQMSASVLLRDPPPADLPARLQQLQNDVLAQVEQDADEAMLILVHWITTDLHQRHATQALLVTVLAELAARQAGGFTPEQHTALRCAALTRQIAMATVQDQLALQDGPPTPQQLAKLQGQAARAVHCLTAAGATDTLWLDLVAQHPLAAAAPSGSPPTPLMRLGRLLERADRYASELAVRKTRTAPPAADAVRAAVRAAGPQAGVDEVGAILVKAVGLHPPGSYVRLSTGEVGVVLRRGVDAASPKVASLLGRSGSPLGEPVVRDTHLRSHQVTGSIAPHEVRVRLNLEKLVGMA